MFETLVLALDGSPSSDRTIAFATQLAREHGSHVHVVHVVEMTTGRGAGPVHPNESELEAKVAEQVAALGEAGITAQLEVHTTLLGGPATVLADVAQRVGADAIVTGTRGHTAVSGLLLGSVTQRLLHVALCPVLVVPPGVPLAPARATASSAATSRPA